MFGLPIWLWVILVVAAVVVIWLQRFQSRYRAMCRTVRDELVQVLKDKYPEIEVAWGANEIEAEIAAGALRASGLHPRVAPDPRSAHLAYAGALTRGPAIVLVPESEADAARAIVRAPRRRRR